MVTGFPSMLMWPESIGSMPKSASASSVRPEPSRPVTPTISPPRISKLMSLSAWSTFSPSTFSSGGLPGSGVNR